MFKNKYRIVRDDFGGFEVQKKRWWLPIWYQMSDSGLFINTFHSLGEAEQFIDEDANPIRFKESKVIKNYDPFNKTRKPDIDPLNEENWDE